MERNLGRPVNDGVNEPCRSCASACCGPNIKIVLTDKERAFLQSAKTVLEPIKNLAENSDMALYLLKSKCGFVDTEDGHKCRVHNDPQRPVVCGELKAGEEICYKIKNSGR
jgi:Fe-S-cluster containining protein